MSNIQYYITPSLGCYDLRKRGASSGEKYKDTLIDTFFAFDDAETERSRLQWIYDRNVQESRALIAIKEYDKSEKSDVDVRGLILQMRMLFTDSGPR